MKMEPSRRNAKPITKQEILIAMSHTRSNMAAARYIGCSYDRWKKYAKLYKDDSGKTLFEVHLNRSGKGVRKFFSSRWGRTSEVNIEDLIEGRVSIDSYTPDKLKTRLIQECYLKEECYTCGYHERRLIDNKIPLLLNFKDGNKKNWRLNNLELKCYNCYFIYVGDIFNKKQILHLEDYSTRDKDAGGVNWELNEEHLEKLKALGL